MFFYEDSNGNVRGSTGFQDYGLGLQGNALGYTGFSNEPGSFEKTFQSLVDEQRSYNQLQMDREDSAYQRMVADMKKAGLNPWTGISTGGLSSSSLTPAKKSGFETLINMLDTSNNSTSKYHNDILSSIKTGAQIALGTLGLFF